MFCDDYLIEGAVGDNDSLTLDSTVDQTTSGDGQRSEVDVTLSGERSNDVRSRSEMNSSTSGNEDLTIDEEEGARMEGKLAPSEMKPSERYREKHRDWKDEQVSPKKKRPRWKKQLRDLDGVRRR